MAAVVVEDGRIIRSAYSLIRPPQLEFDFWNTKIHGITAKDVADKPTFCDLWPRIKPYLDGKIIVAHNAPFDISVLRSMLETYGLAYPDFRYACTVGIAKRVWAEVENYKLSTLASHFAIDFDHHNALHDARTCAMVALKAREKTKAASFEQMVGHLKLTLRKF